MRSHRYRVLSLFGLLVSLFALPGHAGDALSRASALVWDMGEIYWDFGNHHIARGMTPDKVAALADKAAVKLASRRTIWRDCCPAWIPRVALPGT